ncbi:zinc finger BED domain-containing protein 4-like [Anastrepha obliqua]|uniref:zinc finger BED domain-containing protein 4-like n=1 Tax=Anastrepha obliqua TaxID=95512 RepID=UPI002409F938|nr:zinc finger BED domain-containing protein 4-like [Anastrepha obliqua]
MPAVPGTSRSNERQLTLKETSERKLLWGINDSKSIKYYYLIGEMIALDNEPLSLVERVGFQRLMANALPHYKVPGRTYMTEKIVPDIYNRICAKIEASISQAAALSVTSDIWACQHNNESFLSFTAHWISPEFILEHSVLAMKSFPGSHSGINIAKELNAIIERWNIPQSKIHLLVHDSGSNMIKGVQDSGYDSGRCFIHSLQRAIEESLKSQPEVLQMIAATRRIVTHFNHSGLAEQKLKSIQQELNLPNHQLVQDVRTRWNSTYYLMERLLEQKRAISLYITDHENLINLTHAQWELLEQCIKLLKPFEEITKITSSGISCISEVIPHAVTLLKYLGKAETAEKVPNLVTMRSSLHAELERRFSFDGKNKYLVATFLDPRFKTSFLGLVQAEKARQKILLEALKISCDESSSTDDDSSPIRKKRNLNENDRTMEIHDSFWNCFEEVATDNMRNANNEEDVERNTVANELDFYLKTGRLDRKANPYKWWLANENQYPNLSKFAKVYLSSPGSSVYSERLFSEAGNIYDEKRNRLLQKNAEKLVFIHHNLPLINFKY